MLTLQALLKELEFEESLCCTAYALYNLFRCYPETLFGSEVPDYPSFEGGVGKMAGVGPLLESRGLTDRALDAVASGLGLRGAAAALPSSELELRKLLATPGSGFLGRILLREASETVPGVRHSVVLVPVERDRRPLHYEFLDSNGALGERGKFAWKDLSRMLCGIYVLEVQGPRRESGNTVPGLGPKKDLNRPARRADITALRKALAEFAVNPLMGVEALEAAVRAHPRSGVLRALRGAVAVAMTLATDVGAAARANGTGACQARQDLSEALRLEPALRQALPAALTCLHWRHPVQALALLSALAVGAKKPLGDLTARIEQELRSCWS